MQNLTKRQIEESCWTNRKDSVCLLPYLKEYREKFGEEDPISRFEYHEEMGSIDYPDWKQQSLSEIIKCGILRRKVDDTDDALHVFYRLYPESQVASIYDFKFRFLLKEYLKCQELVERHPDLSDVRLVRICLEVIRIIESKNERGLQLTGGDLKIAQQLMKTLDNYLAVVEILQIVKV